MPFEIDTSVDVILTRMFRQAIDLYGVNNRDEIDPVVKMIFEALAVELSLLGSDVANMKARLTEKIANLLSPDFLICPSPAHCLLHAMPNELVETLSDMTDFYTPGKIASKNEIGSEDNVEFFFTPVDGLKVFDIKIAHTFTNNKWYKYDNVLTRQPVSSRVPGKRNEDENTLWLGLKIGEKIKDINNLYFYFTRQIDLQQNASVYQLLPLTKWYINGTEIQIKPGFPYELVSKQNNIADKIFSDNDSLSIIKRDVKNFYDARFITIADENLKNIINLKQQLPPIFQNYIQQSEAEKLLWIKIVFPVAVKPATLEDMTIHLNAFPVMNRRLVDKTHTLQKNNNIIKMETEGAEQFVAVQSVSHNDTIYNPIPFRTSESDSVCTYAVRTGGTERFDSRNAKEFISYMIESFRNESVAYSTIGLGNITQILKGITDQINDLEKKVLNGNTTIGEVPHYVVVKPDAKHNSIDLTYWTTLAENGNNLRAGDTKLQQYSGAALKTESIILLTSSVGGKSHLKPEERISAFKYGLMTRNKIITREDIHNFCFYELGDRINGVSVKKGFEMSVIPLQGFNRTIDITVSPSAGGKSNEREWIMLGEQLKLKLEARSGMSNNYRIFLPGDKKIA